MYEILEIQNYERTREIISSYSNKKIKVFDDSDVYMEGGFAYDINIDNEIEAKLFLFLSDSNMGEEINYTVKYEEHVGRGIKMTLYDTNKVDNIGIAKKDSSVLHMFIHDSFDWKEENEYLYLLQEEVNAYFAFIQDKQYEEYGYNNTNHFIIQIDFKYDIPVSCLNLLENFAEVMEPFNTKSRIELHEND